MSFNFKAVTEAMARAKRAESVKAIALQLLTHRNLSTEEAFALAREYVQASEKIDADRLLEEGAA